MNFDIRFFDQLTFLTGINGSGKTSALNSIAALLLPRLDYLSSQEFDRIALELTDDRRKRHVLSATKTENRTEITCSSIGGEVLAIDETADLESVPPHRVQEYEEGYFAEMLGRNRDNPVLHFINTLPTPMYLGLDRRSLSVTPDRARYVTRPLNRSRVRRNIFGRSLEAGLTDALSFARQQFQVDRRRELALDETFRKTLFLELIDLPLFSMSGDWAEPSTAERKRIEEARDSLERLPEIINVDKKVVHEKLDAAFRFLNEKFKSIKTSAKGSEERMFAQFEWSYNKTNVDKIVRLSEIISEYTRQVTDVKQRTNEYLNTVNGFIRDSGKTMLFNNIGELRFRIDGEDEDKSIQSFSSGEMQLVVILTHLYFNPEAAAANVFIIDEPELSLHVEWQEKFVDGIVAAAGATQLIMATHSPSIILDKRKCCVELVAI